MDRAAVVESWDAFAASVAALGVVVRGAGSGDGAEADPLREWADDCLDGLAVGTTVEAQFAALKVRLAAGFVDTTRALASPDQEPQQRRVQEMAMLSEVACVLTVSERTAGAFLADSQQLATTLPLTLGALQEGSLSWHHAKVMVDETDSLSPSGAAALEAHFLDPDAPDAAKRFPAGEMVPSRFRAKARAWRERHHPESIEKRHARSFVDRRLDYAPVRDGMAWLSAYLPADQAAGIWNRTTTAARALQGPAEDRTLTQLRADVVARILLSAGFSDGTTASANDGVSSKVSAADAAAADDADVGAGADADAGRVPSPAAQVLVTVPIFSLMGLTDEPADLDGYGPIPASMARKLVADGASSFRRVLIDPKSGEPLEIGRKSYGIPPAMRRWLRLRDGRCSFPGCTNHSLDNDADHILAWADGGTTGISNLESLCRKHHRLKHTSAWTPTNAGIDKPPAWTSPTGRHYPSEHHDREPPQLPAMVLEALQELKRTPARDQERAADPVPEADAGPGGADNDRFLTIEHPVP
ncbi:MAG: nuclease [Pseudarthrobacter sp.]|nr:nuclease [Pseudarthrobacter sp.]